jgi:hypothetical protein
VTFVDESLETQQGEDGSSPERSPFAEQVSTRQRTPKKCVETNNSTNTRKSIENFCSSKVQIISSPESECVAVFNATNLCPEVTTSDPTNSQVSCYHQPHIIEELPSESILQRNAPHDFDHAHGSIFSNGIALEDPPNLTAFSPSGFNTTPTHQNSHNADHEDAEEPKSPLQLSPSNSAFTAPAIPMTKEEALLFRHYLENLAPWVS